MGIVSVQVLVQVATDMPADDFAADDHCDALGDALQAAANSLSAVLDGSASIIDFTVLP